MLARLTIEEMHNIAKERGGRCLSTHYVNNNTNLDWKCAEGHQWKATPGNIKAGKWCRTCSIKIRGEKRRLTIEEMHNIAKERGGRCLSTHYVNNNTNLDWKCAEGHQWKATPSNIKAGKWCQICGRIRGFEKQRLTIEEMHNIAKLRGGKCLSTKYTNSKTKLKWECAEGHQWSAIPESVKSGTWCGKCGIYLNEEICRTTFEQIFDSSFPKSTPNWLRTLNNRQMELDGFNKNLKIAFEYQGIQHTRISKYSEDTQKLKSQKTRDIRKKLLCKNNNVHLIVISYRQNLLNLPRFIRKRLDFFGFDVQLFDFDKEIDFNKVYQHRTRIEEMHNIAKERGGRCLSTHYVNNNTNLDWKCAEGHQWKATPSNIKAGKWCKKCSIERRK
jgi:hypothetical protein